MIYFLLINIKYDAMNLLFKLLNYVHKYIQFLEIIKID